MNKPIIMVGNDFNRTYLTMYNEQIEFWFDMWVLGIIYTFQLRLN